MEDYNKDILKIVESNCVIRYISKSSLILYFTMSSNGQSHFKI